MAIKRSHKLIIVLVIISLCLLSFPLTSGVRSATPNYSVNQPTARPTVQPTVRLTAPPTIRPTPTVRPTVQPTATRRGQPELMKLAVIVSTNSVEIPTFGTLKWYKEGLEALIEKEITATFPASKYNLTPAKILTEVLAESGYSLNALEMPEKGDIIEIANSAGADAILVIELSNIGLATSQDLYKFYVVLRYKAYNVREDTYMARRIYYEGEQFKQSTSEKDKVFYNQTIANAVDLALSGLPF